MQILCSPRREVQRITSGPRGPGGRSVKRLKTADVDQVKQSDYGIESRCELDTRADTCCAGINCRPIFYTGQKCEVQGFHDDFVPVPDVPIAIVATTWSDPLTGRGYILIIHEALYFGSSMNHSLINPNQLRHYGVIMHDNPYERDPSRVMGIEIDDNDRLPFYSQGSTVFFNTKYPDDDEMDLYPHVVLTSNIPWDPQGLIMPNGLDDSGLPTSDQAILQVNSDAILGINRHHNMYETDRVSITIDGNTEQLLMEQMINSVHISSTRHMDKLQSKTQHSKFEPEHVASIFNVCLGTAKDILAVTTQEGVRHAVTPLTRRYRVDHIHLNHNYLSGNWTIDHIKSKYKSIRGHTGSIVISNGNLAAVYPTPTKSDRDSTESLRQFTEEIGIPANLKCDMVAAFVGRHTDFQRLVQKLGINMTYAEPYRHNQLQQVNVAIQELKRKWRNKMGSRNVPRRLWCFGLEHQAKLMQFIPRGHNDRSGYKMITGKTPDISEYLDFDFYNLVWYWRTPNPSLSEHYRELARWMGIAHRVGSDMCYWLMPVSGVPVVNSSVQHVTAEDLRNPQIMERVEDFNTRLNTRLDDTNFILPGEDIDYYHPEDTYEIPIDENAENRDPENGDNQEEDIDSYDKLIGATFLLDPLKSPENVATKATVIRRKTFHLGKPLGKAHANPLLDTREYEVQLEDGTYDYYFANTIAENPYTQCDAEGREFNTVRDIIGHKTDGHAVARADGSYIVGNQLRPKKTTAGWKINVKFTDGTTAWLPLNLVKQSNPIELAEYAISNHIDDEPAFKWWVSLVMRKRNRMVNKVKKKYWRTTHKYGIRVPKTVAEALQLDKENGNTYWADAVAKEMGKAKVAYVPIEGVTPEEVRLNKVDQLRGFQEIKCHIIFDVKMDFTRKARFVAGGHMTETPLSLTYSSVVSRESVKVAFLIAALNNLDIMSCDIGNAYLNVKCREKIWFIAGAECGPDLQGCVCKLVRALYGLKSSGAAWRAMFAEFIINIMNFAPTRADADVYMRKNYLNGGSPYYEYLLVYVDDVLVVSHAPEEVMKQIGSEFEIGAEVSKVQLGNGEEC